MTPYARGGPALAAALLATAALIVTSAAAETIHIEVKGLAFIPSKITAHVGDTIEWVNEDFVAHTATARNGTWEVKLPPHAAGRVVLKAPGKVEYYCRYHPNMKGDITVAPERRLPP